MKKKINQAQPEGRTQPEIRINSRWKDSWGIKITVTKVQDNRVTYIRDGYQYECICSGYRLRSDFEYLPEESEQYQNSAQLSASENIRKIKNLIKENQNVIS